MNLKHYSIIPYKVLFLGLHKYESHLDTSDVHRGFISWKLKEMLKTMLLFHLLKKIFS